MIGHNTLSVFRFELRRSLTVSRIGIWLLLVLFPVFIVSVMKYHEETFQDSGLMNAPERTIQYRIDSKKYGPVTLELRIRREQRYVTLKYGEGPNARVLKNVQISQQGILDLLSSVSKGRIDEIIEQHQTRRVPTTGDPEADAKARSTVWGAVLFGLIPELITLFGLLLWITPVVQSELEGRTWIYLAVRPRGRVSVLLGKYLTGITWTALAGWTSVTICILIARPDDAWRLWFSLVGIVAFACLGYGALYGLIGVLLQRRAMVIAVAYTLIFEFLISIVPAVINQFTVQYRLRNLLVQFMGWRELLSDEAGELLLGDQPAWLHILILCCFTVTLLAIAAQVIQRKEYATADEV